jgi:hypothetical protein
VTATVYPAHKSAAYAERLHRNIPVTMALLYKNQAFLQSRPQPLDWNNHLVAEEHTISNFSFNIASSCKEMYSAYLR